MFWKCKSNKDDIPDSLKNYNGFQVLCHARAKLVPWGDSKPDCVCGLLLTELYLYALEDNYNNTYTEHYIIPVKKLKYIVSGTKPGKRVRYYLRIDYMNDESKNETIYFENFNRQTEKMIEKLQELLK